MKLVGQWFKLPPENQKTANALAAIDGVGISEWIATAVAEKIDRDRKSAAQTLSNNRAIAKGVENEKPETNEV
jgi:hypothetical protein